MESNNITYPLEYSRIIYQKAIDWYKSAETKAQIILTLNGVFIGFLGSNYLSIDEIGNFTNYANPKLLPIILLMLILLMLICLITSIICALICIKSRFKKLNLKNHIQTDNKGDILKYDNNLLFFFDHLRQLKPEVVFSQLKNFKPEDEIKILAYGIVVLSENVKLKHKFVNVSFIAFGISLILFILAIAIILLGK